MTNAVILLTVVGGLIWEAIRRFHEPQHVTTGTVIMVAAAGILINGASALLFLPGRRGDLNVRGAFLHLAADAGLSLGVVLTAFAMRWTGLAWIDPAVAIAIAGIIAFGTWSLFRESLNLAMDAVPHEIAPEHVSRFLHDVLGVENVHDLHVWAMSTSESALTVHLVVPGRRIEDDELARLCDQLRITSESDIRRSR